MWWCAWCASDVRVFSIVGIVGLAATKEIGASTLKYPKETRYKAKLLDARVLRRFVYGVVCALKWRR